MRHLCTTQNDHYRRVDETMQKTYQTPVDVHNFGVSRPTQFTSNKLHGTHPNQVFHPLPRQLATHNIDSQLICSSRERGLYAIACHLPFLQCSLYVNSRYAVTISQLYSQCHLTSSQYLP